MRRNAISKAIKCRERQPFVSDCVVARYGVVNISIGAQHPIGPSRPDLYTEYCRIFSAFFFFEGGGDLCLLQYALRLSGHAVSVAGFNGPSIDIYGPLVFNYPMWFDLSQNWLGQCAILCCRVRKFRIIIASKFSFLLLLQEKSAVP